MEHSAAVSVFDSARDLRHQLHALPRFVAERSNVLMQTSLLRELHAKKRQAVLAFAHLINRKNVWVIQTGHRPRFSSEALQGSMGIGAITQHALNRDDALGMSLSGAIDHSHAAATDLLENFVISQLPGLVRRVHLVEHALINRLRYVANSFQSLPQQAAHAKSDVEPHGCSTVFAFCVLFGGGRKQIGEWT